MTKLTQPPQQNADADADAAEVAARRRPGPGPGPGGRSASSSRSSLVETVAGLSAGSAATLIVHPLDIVKTRMQIHRSISVTSIPSSSSSSSSSSTATPQLPPRRPALTSMAVIRSLARTDRPLAALYRGLTPNLLGNATSWASFFFFKSRAERAILLFKGNSSSSSSKGPRKEDNDRELTPPEFFLASLAAGAATQLITNPIWVLKTRMLSSDASAAGAYPSMWAGAARLLRAEGPRGFYRGMGVGMLAVSHGAVQFAVYDPARRWYLGWRERSQSHSAAASVGDDGGGGQHVMTNEATVVLSTVSKLIAGTVTYPLQVLRSRLQHYDAEAQFGKGIRGVVRKLWREEGFRGFYRGMVPGVVRVLPATWVTFLVYENVKYYLYRSETVAAWGF
ncbi:mitochondrial carrier domain-containing protein [Bombardia bombarda]|uniref:Mitochondrial carrier domain-containing protein n=1 Tax=Bombardia bombarda TaxID=252184 RepID=A0AA39XLH5_9PEZI|nr:mitochondrial carrier domain-containing protein [Bombardia bombarda]